MTALQRHGGLTLLWAKWMPSVAHLAPPLAGATSMSRQRFHLYNTAGSPAFLAAVLGGGYFSMFAIGWLGVLVITARWAVAIAFLISSTILVRSFWQRKQALKSLGTAITWRSSGVGEDDGEDESLFWTLMRISAMRISHGAALIEPLWSTQKNATNKNRECWILWAATCNGRHNSDGRQVITVSCSKGRLHSRCRRTSLTIGTLAYRKSIYLSPILRRLKRASQDDSRSPGSMLVETHACAL